MRKMSNKKISFNRGEWAELYVLYCLLSQQVLLVADPTHKNESFYLPILSVERLDGKDRVVKYKIQDSSVIVTENAEEFSIIPALEFDHFSKKLKNDIKRASGRSFSIDSESINFMKKAKVICPKAQSFPMDTEGAQIGGKSDLLLTFYNERLQREQRAGFSIKTKFSHPATLQNGSSVTNFRYELVDLEPAKAEEINNIRQGNYPDFFTRCEQLELYCTKIVPCGVAPNRNGDVFRENLMLVDSKEEETLSRILQLHYFEKSHITRLKDMPRALANYYEPPGKIGFYSQLYEKRISDYLFAVFSGLIPSKPWDNHKALDGGYLCVNENFDIVAALAADSEKFKAYLLDNTRLDHPSATEKRSNYGFVFKEGGKYYIDLNLQIRFTR